MKLSFTKMQGLGNDFVAIDGVRREFRGTPALFRHFGDRRFGVGCDQIVLVEPPSAAGADFDYRIWNSDGSEAGMSGNGARCLARFIRDQGLSHKDVIKVRTKTTVIELTLLPDGRVRVDAGVPRFDPADVPFTAPARALRYSVTLDDGGMIEVGAASMGNPHVVLETRDLEAAPVEEIGRALQSHPAFPQRVNVGFLQVVDSSHAKLRVYERGAGETLACGSGACAALAVGRTWGVLGAQVEMQVRGGVLRMEWAGEGQPVYMTGPATTVYRGDLEWKDGEGKAAWAAERRT
jgi:diaminopimelate epimerase